MTCYVDDMTLSGVRATKGLIFKVRSIIAHYGLKSHKARVFAPSQPKVITGVCNTRQGKRVPNKLQLKIKKGFDDLSKAETPKARQQAINPLLGRLEAAGQIDSVFRARATTLRATYPVTKEVQGARAPSRASRKRPEPHCVSAMR